MEPKTTGRRIVSKGEYAKVQAKKAQLWSKAVLMVLIGVYGVGWELRHPNSAPPLMRDVLFGLWVFISFSLVCTARNTVQRIYAMEPIVPLTRANTADLPAPDSLVRASSEPVQAQQAVLLRAATEDHERHEEQLLRASAAGQEQE